ncbi:MAG: ABC transporter ATP-binding protein [Verrucomicrobia bacterium]|nr:ABC transporter ATP-binding protein [Verrucomicrobiota bacterium]MCH8514342.1 ABC transporter ATP-binding protein [Kiritimatiellia bacterium]
MKAVLEVRNLSKQYPPPTPGAPAPPPVLRDVNFTLNPGEFCAVTGPSGSGKTTFLNLIGLLDPPSRGEILFDGHPVDWRNRKARAEIRKRGVGMIFQNMHLLPRRSVRENILFRARYLNRPLSDFTRRTDELMDELGLSPLANHRADTLSGGEAQRVAIARALLTQPRLLLADEPTGNLDAEAGDRVMRALTQAAESGIGVILVTHNLQLLPYVQSHYQCNGQALRVANAECGVRSAE